MKKKVLFLTFLVILSVMAFSQLTVQNGLTGQQLADILAGENITATNVSISGNPQQYGKFNFIGNGLDVHSGVILSTGKIIDAVGPNNSSSTSTNFGGPGNILLTELAGSDTHDAVVFQLSFEVQTDKIEFNFNFLSEEYNEFVGSTYNDVFAFYISGPGINGEENLAVVPGTTVPVSINTINSQSFWQFYHDNTFNNTNIEFDGFTTLLKAQKSGLIPCQTYTLKIMIADAGDGIYDAGVLLQENSLIQENITAITNTYSGNNIALEGCIEASFTFNLDEALTNDLVIPFSIEGSAVNGVDYEYIDPMIIIPEGQTSATIIIKSLLDGINEGQERVELIFTPGPCQEPDTVFLYIDDFVPIQFTTTETPLSCYGYIDGQLLLSISGGNAPYLVNLTDTLTGEQNSYSANPILNIPSGTYSVNILDNYGCTADDVIFGDIFNAGTTFLPTGTGVTYETSIEITGFSEGETLQSVDQLKLISASMEHSYANDLSITLRAPNGSEVTLKVEGDGYIGSNPNNSCDFGEPVASGRVDQWNNNNITPGVGYEYVWNSNPTYGTMSYQVDHRLLTEHTYTSTYGNQLTDYYYPSGSYTPEENFNDFIGTPLNGLWTIVVTDFYILDNGYIFEWGISLSSPQSDSIITISEPSLPLVTNVETKPGCGQPNGSIDLTVNGNQSPYTYIWNTGATTQDLLNIPAGSYHLGIKGADNCQYNYDYDLSNNGTLAITAESYSETCVDADNASIDLTVNGGTSPFNYLWSNGAQSEDISGLTPGNYTVTVNDAANCKAIQTYPVDPAVPMILTSEITHENCGDAEGIIDLSVSGGVAPYTYLWSNGMTNEDINELAAGSYTVTITDSNGCTTQGTFTIINYVGNCIPNCDLALTNEILTDETCGQQNGAIDLTVFTSWFPYTINWSNGSHSDDIADLPAGTYSLSITDAKGCELTNSYTIHNNTGNLEIVSMETQNETCGNSSGSVNIFVNGGALPYEYSWSNGATTQDLINIGGGIYTVTVTDANGCSVNDAAEVINQSGTLHLAWSNVMNESCGNHQGSIDIWVQGGNPFGYPNPNYIYQWSNGATTEDLVYLTSGTYQCVITDEDGCEITTPIFTVENIFGNLHFTDIDIDHEVCGNTQGEIELFVSGGTGSYTYNWSTGTHLYGIFNVPSGIYSATVSDQNGCSIQTGNLEVLNLPGSLTLNTPIVADEFCSNSQGSINVTLSGGTLPYGSIWNTGSTSEDLFNLNAGNYSCIITDNNGCEINFNTTVNNNQGTLEVLNTVVTNETCGNGNGGVNLILTGGTMPYAFAWNTGASSEDLINLFAGTYSCLITDVQGCQTDATALVGNNSGTLHLDNYVLTNEQCGGQNGSINLIVSGSSTPFSYSWSNGAVTEDINSLSAGTYTCTITDALGCSIIAGPFTVNNTSSLMSVSYSVTDETCGNANGSINLTVNGGSSPFGYLWSNGATTQDITGLQAGSYTYHVTDNSNCILSGDIQVLNNSGSLAVSNVVLTDELCSNSSGAINITLSGGSQPYQFNWNTGAVTEDLINLSAGAYHVTVTDNNGCNITQNYNINNNPGNFELVSLNVMDEICGNSTGAINVVLTGGINPITYVWSNGSTTKNITGLSEGLYTCATVDFNGCPLNYDAYVGNNSGNLYVAITEITDATCGEQNGAVDINVNGGTIPYNFDWSNGESTEDITNVGGGLYTCLVSDNAGCESNINAIVEDISGDMTIIVLEVVDEICGNGGGSINISVNGGIEPYTYVWSNGQTDQDIADLSAGTYEITVIDALGCTQTTSVTLIDLPSTITVTEIITDEFCNNNQGSINITVFGGLAPYDYTWSNGINTQDLYNLSEGDYSVTISDANGCTLFEIFTIENITTLDIVSTAANETCGQSNGMIDITVNASSGTPSFLWNTGATTEDLIDIPAGSYSCEITDDNGCTQSVFYELINETGNMTVVPTITDDYCGTGGAIELVISGTPSGFTVLWSNGSSDPSIYNLSEGTYSVEVTDNSNGCLFYASYTVYSYGLFTVSEVVTNSTCETCNDGSINLTLDPVDTYTYSWSNGETTEDIENLLPGDYSVLITNMLYCEFEQTYTVGNEVLINNPEESLIHVYPNPTFDVLKITYEGIKEETVIRIVNVTGSVILETKIKEGKGWMQIDLSEYASGIYYLIAGNNTQNETLKIIKR